MAYPGMIQYDAQYPLYGLSFSNSPSHPLRVATTTLSSNITNKLLILDIAHAKPTSPYTQNPSPSQYSQLASANLAFPATKVGWEPGGGGRGPNDDESVELLATTGDMLRIWDLRESWEEDNARGRGFVRGNGYGAQEGRGQGGYQLKSRSVLSNSKSQQGSLPPVTSFSWNQVTPSSIVTCSIDTTATLWDINTSQALTQLIAHDRAVFDLSWLPDSNDIFVSVGADGSLRAFDLRQLEHSTILYESSEDTPLARIAFSNKEQHMLACFGLDDHKTLILDMRSPGQPIAELAGHQAPLGGIAWGSGGNQETSSGGWIASCGDDCQLLLYDLTSPLPTGKPSSQAPSRNKANNGNTPNAYGLSPSVTPATTRGSPAPADAVDVFPVKAWTAESEVNNLAFTDEGDWLGCVNGSKLNVLKV